MFLISDILFPGFSAARREREKGKHEGEAAARIETEEDVDKIGGGGTSGLTGEGSCLKDFVILKGHLSETQVFGVK